MKTNKIFGLTQAAVCLRKISVIVFGILLFHCQQGAAQGDFEIQVYGSDISSQELMLELHSNASLQGSWKNDDGIVPTHNLAHETIELSYGWNNWCQTGVYLFNAVGDNDRTSVAGFHVRQMFAVQQSHTMPVGLGFSAEYGYIKKEYSDAAWALEMRPIVDKRWKKMYISFNPVLGMSFQGQAHPLDFSPNVKISYAVVKKCEVGFEYYGSLGNMSEILPYQHQPHQLFVCSDIDFGEQWEFNAGYGIAMTSAGENGVVKIILGRKIRVRKMSAPDSKQ
jgi:hypothetical protein